MTVPEDGIVISIPLSMAYQEHERAIIRGISRMASLNPLSDMRLFEIGGGSSGQSVDLLDAWAGTRKPLWQ